MRIEDLRYFLAVSDEGLVHKAAEKMGISQPALTKAIQRLEISLGVSLFTRTPRGMALTRFGKIFHSSALKLAQEYESALHLIDEEKSGDFARVRIGVTPACEMYVNETFIRMHQHRPTMRISSHIQLSSALLNLLRNGTVNVVIAPVPFDIPDDVEMRKVRDERFHIIARKSHPAFEFKPTVTAKDIKEFKWILPDTTIHARQQIEDYYLSSGINGPDLQITSNYISTAGVFRLVSRTDLLGICSHSERNVAQHAGNKILHLSDRVFSRQLAIFTLKNVKISPLTIEFIENISDIMTGGELDADNQNI